MGKHEFGGREYGSLSTAVAVAEDYRDRLVAQIRHKKARTLPGAFRTYMKCREEYAEWVRGVRSRKRTEQERLLDGLRRMRSYADSRAEYLAQQESLATLRERLAKARGDLKALRAGECR